MSYAKFPHLSAPIIRYLQEGSIDFTGGLVRYLDWSHRFLMHWIETGPNKIRFLKEWNLTADRQALWYQQPNRSPPWHSPPVSAFYRPPCTLPPYSPIHVSETVSAPIEKNREGRAIMRLTQRKEGKHLKTEKGGYVDAHQLGDHLRSDSIEVVGARNKILLRRFERLDLAAQIVHHLALNIVQLIHDGGSKRQQQLLLLWYCSCGGSTCKSGTSALPIHV